MKQLIFGGLLSFLSIGQLYAAANEYRGRTLQQRCTDGFVARGIGASPSMPPTIWDGFRAAYWMDRVYENAATLPPLLSPHLQLNARGVDGMHQGHRVRESVRLWERAYARFGSDMLTAEMAAGALVGAGVALYIAGATPLRDYTRSKNLMQLFEQCAGRAGTLCIASVFPGCVIAGTLFHLAPNLIPAARGGYLGMLGASGLSSATAACLGCALGAYKKYQSYL